MNICENKRQQKLNLTEISVEIHLVLKYINNIIAIRDGHTTETGTTDY
jgi:hypothetical protein